MCFAGVFRRATKNALVQALRKRGTSSVSWVTASNDAPGSAPPTWAFSVRCDNAVDIAKESADVIPAGKELMVLEEGVLEGPQGVFVKSEIHPHGASSIFGNMSASSAPSAWLP